MNILYTFFLLPYLQFLVDIQQIRAIKCPSKNCRIKSVHVSLII